MPRRVSPVKVDCPNYVRHQDPNARFGSSQFELCNGSQTTTWGGYVCTKDLDERTFGQPSQASVNRGRFSGSMARNRKIAKVDISHLVEAGPAASEEEEKVRQAEIAKVEDARANVKKTRQRQKLSRQARMKQEVEADPRNWQCPNCYNEDEQGKKSDVQMRSDKAVCRKCSVRRPGYDEYWAGARWMCPECSSDTYTISGHRTECPDCGRSVDWDQDAWWWMPRMEENEPRRASGSAGQCPFRHEPRQDPGPGADQPPKKRKRGGKKHRKKSPPRTVPDEAEDSEDRVRRHDDDAESSDSFQRRKPNPNDPESRKWSGGARRARVSVPVSTLPLGAVVLSSLAVTSAGQPIAVNHATSAVVLGVTALGIILQRGYQTVDIVLQAAENQTVEVIKAVGETSIGIMPVIAGAIVTMILLGLRLVVRRFWPSAKEELCLAGKNPEGNVEVASGSSGAYPSQSDKFPSLPWVTRDLLARAVANLTDASKIAEKPEMATRIRDSPCHLIWKVESQSGAKPYYVRLAKTALSRFTVQPMV